MNEAPVQPVRAEVRPVGRVEQAKAKVKELTKKGKEWFKDKWNKVTNKPREVLNDINISVPTKKEDVYLVDSTEKTNSFPKIPDNNVLDQQMKGVRLATSGVTEQMKRGSETKPFPHFFEVKEQVHGELKTKVDETLEEGINKGNIKFVYQRGIGFSDSSDPKTRFIETSDFGSEKPMFGSCVVLVARSPETKKTVVLHADKQTDLQAARAQMSQFFGKERVSLAVIGGQSDNSEEILNDINETFTQEPGWKLNQLDILGEKFRQVRQVIVDTETGAIYDLQGEDRRNMKPWSYDQPAEIKARAGKAATIQRGLHIDIPQHATTMV